MLFRSLGALSLAKVKKIAPTPQVAAIKPIVDMDTLRAVLTNRFRVMAYYCKLVLLPVRREERRHLSKSAHGLLRHARHLLVRDEALLDREAQQKLDQLLSVSKRLKTAYVYKQRLQQIWKRSTVDQDALLFALREWCRQAEAAGIAVLQDFARSLRGYTLAKA